MLVTVQFPYDLVVTDRREIKERNFKPRIERRALSMHRIEMPIDIFAARIDRTTTSEAGSEV